LDNDFQKEEAEKHYSLYPFRDSIHHLKRGKTWVGLMYCCDAAF